MIFYLEDDVNIRKLVCYALIKEGYEVIGLSSPEEFWDKMKTETPELILLDIMLPDEDGLTILKKLKNDNSSEDIPVIMITAKDSEFDTVTGLDSGADDYISKPFGMTELVSRVKAVIRRFEKINKKKEYRIADLYVDLEKYLVKVSGKEVSLSFKEFQLLTVLLEAQGKVVTRDELLLKVWGEYYDESRTLDVHIRKLRVKLESAGELIHTVKNVGYKLGGSGNV